MCRRECTLLRTKLCSHTRSARTRDSCRGTAARDHLPGPRRLQPSCGGFSVFPRLPPGMGWALAAPDAELPGEEGSGRRVSLPRKGARRPSARASWRDAACPLHIPGYYRQGAVRACGGAGRQSGKRVPDRVQAASERGEVVAQTVSGPRRFRGRGRGGRNLRHLFLARGG